MCMCHNYPYISTITLPSEVKFTPSSEGRVYLSEGEYVANSGEAVEIVQS